MSRVPPRIEGAAGAERSGLNARGRDGPRLGPGAPGSAPGWALALVAALEARGLDRVCRGLGAPGWALALVAALGVSAAALAAPAHAQSARSCALWVGYPPDSLGQAEHPAAVEGAQRALRGMVDTVLPLAQARDTLRGRPIAECAQAQCAPEVARALSVDLVAVVTVWRNAAGAPTQVVVTLVPPEGTPESADLPVPSAGQLAAAAAEAATAALSNFRAARAGLVRVDSVPPGAVVEIDGEHAGHTPYERLMPAGIHTLRLALEGYRVLEREITVDPRSEQTVGPLALQPSGGDASGGGGVSPALGIALGAGGLALLGVGGGFLIGGAVQASDDLYEPNEALLGTWAAVAGVGLAVGVVGLVLLLAGGDDADPPARAFLGPWTLD